MKLILFNVCFVAVLACLIKPHWLSRYTGSAPLSRWWFLGALILLTMESPYGPNRIQPMQAPAPHPPAQAVDEPTPAAPAAQVPTTDAAAAR